MAVIKGKTCDNVQSQSEMMSARDHKQVVFVCLTSHLETAAVPLEH